MIGDTPKHGPTLIAAGLIMLLTAEIWPAMPVASAVMLIAWGATRVLLVRSPWRKPGRGLMVVHLATYAALYSLFIGAIVDRSLRVDGRIAWATAADLIIATCLLALVVRQALPALRDTAGDRC